MKRLAAKLGVPYGAEQTETKAKQSKIEQYQRSLRSAARGFWSGALDFDQFFDAMVSAIDRGLTGAWHEGAAECGILPDDLSPQELTALEKRLVSERDHIAEFGDYIEANSKANGGKLTPIFSRLKLWSNRYQDITNEAKVMACKDQKLAWRLGATERHCRTCPNLDGRVKRASFWEKVGVRPQNPPNALLECQGWRCLCELIPTDAPVSRGPLPRLP